MKRLVLFVFALIASFAVKGTDVSGTVLVDTHWTLSGSPYTLIGIFGVNTGATLTIDPGVQVNGNFDLIILGKIIVNGDNGNTVKFQDTRLLFKKTNIGLSSIEYTEFNHSGVQLADETESAQDNPKNSGTLLVKNCTFSNGGYAYTKGFREPPGDVKLRIEDSNFADSSIKGFSPRSEIIELDHTTISNSSITSDSYNYGIKMSNVNISGTHLTLGCCESSFAISNSSLTNSLIDGGFFSYLTLTSSTLTDTFVNLPSSIFDIYDCQITASQAQSYLIQMGIGQIKNTTIKGIPTMTLVKVFGRRGSDLRSALFDKVDFKDCSTAVEVVDFLSLNFFHCNFLNPTQYAINNQASNDLDAKSNYWGTATESVIPTLIFDRFDNINKGVVDYSNFLTSKALFTPIVTWNNPAPMNYGNALTAAQLNATVDSPGTLTYTPPLGTTLNAGASQVLGVNFTPTDPANYYPATAQVNITVNKSNQTINFGSIALKTLGDASFSLAASSNSGLAVGFASTSDKIQISGNQVSILKSGRVTISATQAGSINYNAATPVTQTFCITPAKPTIAVANPNSFPLSRRAQPLAINGMPMTQRSAEPRRRLSQ